ncbi:hypothetical protein EJ08DRAFT_696017 [Tothia fuscella]|uniref:K Homology domain-containing protein n=1 Tax=Tothia fuscella TaxID=1048955 RepID=A0A9P4NUC0_9PEZI|nr:hypothetical protein EJ08DRAFT_696017 [Tothia fuscella]
MAEEETPRRSRFDQKEPAVAPRSRFDRRSRSPITRQPTDSRRSRTPTSEIKSPKPAAIDPAKKAAEAAARINALLQQKKAIQTVDVPQVRSSTTPDNDTAANEVYTQDGDFIKDIEVNDLRNRYTLTKGATQKMIKELTGADVTTRGEYYPDKNMATPAAPPLYLHITSQSKDGLERAVAKIEELMTQDLPNLVDERRFRRRDNPEPVERDEFGRRKWPEERIPIDLEPIPGFNLRAQVVGAGGAYVKYIQGKTKCRVQIKGRGSGFTEHGTGVESDEPMYLHVAGPDPAQVQIAKSDCLDLLQNVKTQYEQFKANGPTYGRQQHGGGGHDGGGGYNNNRGGAPGQQRQNSGSYGGYGQQNGGGGNQGHGQQYGHQNDVSSPSSSSWWGWQSHPPNHQPNTPYSQPSYGGGAPTAGSPTSATPIDDPNAAAAAAWAEYYKQNGQEAPADPYAAYGGYEAYQAMAAQYYAQQQPAQASPTPGVGVDPNAYAAAAYAAPGGYSASPVGGGGYAGSPGGYGAAPGAMGQGYQPPPPPPSDGAAPPPPPGSGYNSVPPPPGM